MNKSRIILLFFLLLVYSTSMAGLEVRITPSKSTYLLREPIAIHYHVKILGPDSVQFDPNEIVNSFRVVDSKNSRDFIYGHYTVEHLLPSGRPPTFSAGDSLEGTVDLDCGKKGTNSSYTLTLPVEKYRVYLEIEYDDNKRSKSNMAEFEIVEPSGREEWAYSELLAADSLRRLKDVTGACRKLVRISQNHPTSVYAQSSLRTALISYLYAGGDKSKLAELSREFIDKYPNSRYIDTPLWILIEYYQSKKDKIGYSGELKSLIEKYPGTEVEKQAKKRLENFDKVRFSE